MSNQRFSVTPLEATAIGAASGVIEVTIMQPTVTIKNAMQQGRPLPTTPLALYRGLLINAASVAPITATQFGANRFFEKTVTSLTGEGLSQSQRVAVAMAAGSTSALISCPSELIMIQQQMHGTSLAQAFRDFLQQHGILRIYRGLGITMAREGLYTAGYLGICPVLKEYLEAQGSLQGVPGGPMMVAGITGGLFASVGTQWADTVKTRMQSHPTAEAAPQYRSALTTARAVYGTLGLKGLWAGALPRMVRIVGATFILNYTRTGMTDWVEARKESNSLFTPDL